MKWNINKTVVNDTHLIVFLTSESGESRNISMDIKYIADDAYIDEIKRVLSDDTEIEFQTREIDV